jgi:hypothetical protein
VFGDVVRMTVVIDLQGLTLGRRYFDLARGIGPVALSETGLAQDALYLESAWLASGRLLP